MHLHCVLNCNVICRCLPEPGMSFRPRLPCYSTAPRLVIASTSPKLLWTHTTYALSRELFVLYCGCPALNNCEILLLIPLLPCMQLLTRPGWYVEVPDKDTPFSVQFTALAPCDRYPLSGAIMVDGQKADSCMYSLAPNALLQGWTYSLISLHLSQRCITKVSRHGHLGCEDWN
jgi:hypothetical protein